MGLDFKKLAKEAKENTNEKMAGEISSLIKMTDEEFEKLFPEKTEKENATELLKIIKSSTELEERKSSIMKNSDKFINVMIKIIDKLV